ncbi:MAG: 30S ribosomal protein S16 [Deltaproteobacteria bacterium]|nr:30S ribosomal protein S16 [Deltaproteobacteria bacterium]
METRIRLARFGAKKKPFYRIVVANLLSPRNGTFLDVLGHYDPQLGVTKADIDQEKASLWIKRGAQATGIVKQILKQSVAA